MCHILPVSESGSLESISRWLQVKDFKDLGIFFFFVVFYSINSSTFINFPSEEGLEVSSKTCFEKFDYDLGHYDGARGSRRIRASYGGEGVALGVAS